MSDCRIELAELLLLYSAIRASLDDSDCIFELVVGDAETDAPKAPDVFQSFIKKEQVQAVPKCGNHLPREEKET